jgi:DNA-binding SARP family transcriptional activator
VTNPGRGAGAAVLWRLSLLGGWRLKRDGARVHVSPSAQRLIALVALRGPSERALVLGTLWPDVSEARAATNLRSALHRMHYSVPGVLTVRRDEVALGPEVRVDVDVLTCAGLDPDDDGQWASLAGTTRVELLPGWYDDWVLEERERIRQLWLHTVERRALALADRHDYQRALDAALLAVGAEPMRESAHRLVVRIHLAEGNVSEAVRSYLRYVDLLRRELGVRPTARMTEILAGFAPSVDARRGAVHESRPAQGRWPG